MKTDSIAWLQSNSLFSKGYERAQLLIPIILLVAAIVEILLYHRYFTNEALTLNFVQNIIFLNSLHVWFTYLLLWSNRGGRNWATSMLRSTTFKVRCAVVFLFFAGFYYFYREVAPRAVWGTTLVDAVLIFSGRYHEVAQSRGIGLLYDAKYSTAEIRKKAEFSLIQMSQSVFGFSSSGFSFLVLCTYRSNSPVYDIVTKTFRSHSWEVLLWLCLAVSLLCILTLFVCTHRLYPASHAELRKKKTLFNIRYVIKLLSFHSSLAAFFSNATHGVEYLAVYSKLDTEKERIVSQKVFRIFLASSVFLFIFFRYPFLFGSYTNLADSSIVVSLMMSVVAGLTFLHYFIDGYMFQHRSAVSREQIIKRLVS